MSAGLARNWWVVALRGVAAIDDSLSTDRRQSGILVNVHPVLLWNTEALQLQSPRSGPGRQPNESSQLVILARSDYG
jgi:hypothetical protein